MAQVFPSLGRRTEGRMNHRLPGVIFWSLLNQLDKNFFFSEAGPARNLLHLRQISHGLSVQAQ